MLSPRVQRKKEAIDWVKETTKLTIDNKYSLNGPLIVMSEDVEVDKGEEEEIQDMERPVRAQRTDNAKLGVLRRRDASIRNNSI